MKLELIDRIYESSFVPELWPSVLVELSKIAEARGGILCTVNSGIINWTSTESMRGIFTKYIEDGWIKRCTRRVRWFSSTHASFFVEYDLWTAEELDNDPIYCDFLRPLGFGWSAATAMPMPTGDAIFVSLERDHTRGPVEGTVVGELNELRPHLARSVLLAARLKLERARVASETLAALGLPALVLNEQGKVIAANSLIEAMPDYVQWRAFDRITLKDRAADQLLRDAIAAIDVAGGSVRSFPVRDVGAEAMMVAHVIPIRLAARDIFVRCAAALVLTPVTLPQAPPVELVQSLFDLTPAEARVARSLASGETVESIASARGVSQNTIRAHVRGVLEKSGCNRQVDIVALLTAISPARLTPPA